MMKDGFGFIDTRFSFLFYQNLASHLFYYYSTHGSSYATKVSTQGLRRRVRLIYPVPLFWRVLYIHLVLVKRH